MHMDQGSSNINIDWRMNELRAGLRKRASVYEKLHVRWQRVLAAQKVKKYLVLHLKVWLVGQRSEISPGVLHWGPQHKRNKDLSQWVQRRVTTIISSLEHFSYEEKLRVRTAWPGQGP